MAFACPWALRVETRGPLSSLGACAPSTSLGSLDSLFRSGDSPRGINKLPPQLATFSDRLDVRSIEWGRLEA